MRKSTLQTDGRNAMLLSFARMIELLYFMQTEDRVSNWQLNLTELNLSLHVTEVTDTTPTSAVVHHLNDQLLECD